ncbi:sodium:solute symporter family transporter [Lacipirellula sp.]|uniref:sodium:solute symporter family transporter n=1 Tax=Lacipirellula sp. TaxID=2691419 RepID=UPI003D0C86FD
MGLIDLIIVVVYLLAVVAVGCWSSLRKSSEESSAGAASEYFLAGGTLRWPIIGMALFATNISTVHVVGLAEAGFKSGLLMGNFELLAGFTLILLANFFAPLYIRSQVVTLPDFLEKRYSRPSRDVLAIVSVVSAVFVHIGFSLYTGAVVMNGIVGVDISLVWSVIAIALLTGLYTILGGLTAVVVTESLQTIVLLAGAIVISAVAWVKAGGWEGIHAHVPATHLSLIRAADDPDGLPWYSLALGYPVIGIWYWCTDQTIVQRVLGAKDENHARVGALFAGFIKILPLFIFVVPGIACYSLVQQGIIPAEKLSHTEQTYAVLVQELLPVGVRGLMGAALLAAVMSTVSGALNSIGTLVSYDMLKRWRPETSDRALVSVGRWSSFIALLMAIAWSLTLSPSGIFQSINAMITYVAPPITCVFLFGVFWRRASAPAAFATLTLGSLVGVMLFMLEKFKVAWWVDLLKAQHIDFLLIGVLLFVLCTAIMVTVSLARPHVHTTDSERLVWRTPWEPLEFRGWPGIMNYKWLTALLAAVLAAVYTLLA